MMGRGKMAEEWAKKMQYDEGGEDEKIMVEEECNEGKKKGRGKTNENEERLEKDA